MLRLRSNGVQGIFSTYCFKWALRFTTSATDPKSSTSMVDYLVNSLGFSKAEAIVASSKVRPLKSTETPAYVVDFLKNSGLDNAQIKNVVSSVPMILSLNVDKTLKPKIKAFQDLGLSGSDLAVVISLNRRVLDLNLNTHIEPTLKLLKKVVSTNDNLLRALKQSPWFLWNSALKHLPGNVALLESYGFSAGQIEKLLLRKPRYFVMYPKMLQAVLVRVEEKFQVPRGSPLFFRAVCVLCSLSENTLDFKIAVYKSFGWTESDIWALFKANPYHLLLSETKIRSGLKFFMEDLGYDPNRIINSGALAYSLEKRVIPRITVLKILREKNLIKIQFLLACLWQTESSFLKKFVLPFKDEVPGLYENYTKSVGSSLKSGNAKEMCALSFPQDLSLC